MSTTTARPRVARAYTSARRHPWVLGKLGDWVIWFGPYTPAQMLVMGGGAFALIKTFTWWSWMGPVPVVGWLLSIWAVRGAKIAGQSPFAAAWGWLTLLTQPTAGRIAGRTARDRRPTKLTGTFGIECAAFSGAQPLAVAAAAPAPLAHRRPLRTTNHARFRRPGLVTPGSAAPAALPISGLAQLLHAAHISENEEALR